MKVNVGRELRRTAAIVNVQEALAAESRRN